MLIVIDKSVASLDLSKNLNACCGIGTILDAAHRGEHLVTSDRMTLNFLANNTNLSKNHKITAKNISSNLSTLGKIEETISNYARIIHDDNKNYIEPNSNYWDIPIEIIGKTGLSKSVLLTENLDDAKLYIHAASQYRALSRINLAQNLEKSCGGGSTTPVCFENHISNENKWCLCITDSDRLTPSDNMDATALKCAYLAKNTSLVAKHIDLTVREIENLIPISLLKEGVPDSHSKYFEMHYNSIIKNKPEAHHYSDLKEGVFYRDVLQYPALTPREKYWKSVASTLNRASTFSRTCVTDGTCNEKSSNACKCALTHGFSKGLLDSVLMKLKKTSAHAGVKMVKNDFNSDRWFEVGKSVFEWGLAPAKARC